MNRVSVFSALGLMIVMAACSQEPDMEIVGLLESDRIELSVEYAEPLRSRHVVEGESVQAGQLLVEQDDRRMRAAVREAAARVAETQARLAELLRGPRSEQIRAARADVAGAQDETDFQRLELARAQEVFERNLAARETVDRAQAALDSAVARLQVSKARLEELLAGTTVEELRQVEQQLEQRRAQLTAREIDLDRLTISAPVDGVVDTLLLEPGELPLPGTTAVVVLSGKQPYARVYVPEAQRVHVSPGTRATVHVDGLQQSLNGRVRWVSSDAAFTPYFALTEHDRGRLAYAAEITLEYTGDRLPDGVPVQVRFDPSPGQNQAP